MKPVNWIVISILAVAMAFFTGCSSGSDDTASQEADTFTKYSGFVHEVEFRGALRNSLVGASGTNETQVVALNDDPDNRYESKGGASGFFMDIGKDMCKKLVGKGLSYAVDKAFGIESKSQKNKDETNFINNSLVGIQHQLTLINNNLGEVADNQIAELKAQHQDQTEVLDNFADSTETIITNSGASQTFNSSYSDFISSLEKHATDNYQSLDIESMCDSTNSDFIAKFYGNLEKDNIKDTILQDAYNVLTAVIGSVQNTPKTGDGSWAHDLHNDANDFMNNLLTPGYNAVANYYAAGTRFSQSAMAVANLLQQTYTVFAFTLQFASECPEVQTFFSDSDATPGAIFEDCKPCDDPDDKHCNNGQDCSHNIFEGLTSNNFNDQLDTLHSNFKGLYIANAEAELEHAGKPFVSFPISDDPKTATTTYDYWDTSNLLTNIGCNLEDNFIQNGCIPLSYVKDVNNNDNLDYLAAECNYNNNWTVLQLYIPTNNGTEGLINIRYLNDYGLIGDIDYSQVVNFLNKPGTVASDGTCDSHYKHVCTCGFSDCYVENYSVALQGPLYGSGEIYEGCGPCELTSDWCGMNQRYWGDLCNCGFNGNSCSSGTSYVGAITPNGHVFAGAITNKYARNSTMHGWFCTNVEFGVMSLTESGASVSDRVFSYSDSTQKTGPTQIRIDGSNRNADGENGADPDYAEYGFVMTLENAPQPDANTYPICAEGKTIYLDCFYPDSYSGTGIIAGAYSVSDVMLNSGQTADVTIDTDYKTLTVVFGDTSQVWHRYTADDGELSGPDDMQALWTLEIKNGNEDYHEYMTTRCGEALPEGNYRLSCSDLEFIHNILSGNCNDGNGGNKQTTLEVTSNCNYIENIGGILTCTR